MVIISGPSLNTQQECQPLGISMYSVIAICKMTPPEPDTPELDGSKD
jgi:hypothetical protein